LEQRQQVKAEAASSNTHERKALRQNRAEQRKATQPLRQKVKQLETALSQAQKQLAEVEVQLANPALYEQSNGDTLKQLGSAQKQQQQQIDTLEEDWLEASEALEQANAGE
jgi:ATP-binding cassette subfamily F protein 3